MGSDFTIIMWVRHRFGAGPDEPGSLDIEPDSNAPFVGLVGEFPFSCSGIDSSQGAVLQFQYRGSTLSGTPVQEPPLVWFAPEYPVSINGQVLAGGVPGGPSINAVPMWSTRALLIDPDVLRDENILRIAATTDGSLTGDSLFNFTIDNVVVFFKLKRPDELVRPRVVEIEE